MPNVTRSQRNKGKDPQPESSTQQIESNPFDEYVNVGETKIIEELLQQCHESASFQKLVERIIKSDKQKYFLMLTSKGVRIPTDFDIDNLRNTKERNSSTMERTYTYNTQNQEHLREEDTHDQDNTRNRDTTHDHDNLGEEGNLPHRRFEEGNMALALLTQQIQTLQHQMQDMKQGSTTRYYLEDIFPYPFDKRINMIPFPLNSNIPKYDKYNGKSDPHDHVREFCTMSLEFSHNDMSMMRLFPRSLRGQIMEWLSKLTPPMRLFDELVNKFLT